jgi:hypothetical protein
VPAALIDQTTESNVVTVVEPVADTVPIELQELSVPVSKLLLGRLMTDADAVPAINPLAANKIAASLLGLVLHMRISKKCCVAKWFFTVVHAANCMSHHLSNFQATPVGLEKIK